MNIDLIVQKVAWVEIIEMSESLHAIIFFLPVLASKQGRNSRDQVFRWSSSRDHESKLATRCENELTSQLLLALFATTRTWGTRGTKELP